MSLRSKIFGIRDKFSLCVVVRSLSEPLGRILNGKVIVKAEFTGQNLKTWSETLLVIIVTWHGIRESREVLPND